MIRQVTLIAAALILSACATKPVSMSSAVIVPKDRVISAEFLQPDEKRTEKVTIIRDSGFMGSALKMLVSVNADQIASLDTGEMISIYLAPGRYIFVAQGKPNPFNEPPGETEAMVLEDQPNRFRLRLVSGDGPRFERTIQP